MNTTEHSIAIGGRRVGANRPCYVIAEIGVNHNGNSEIAHKMITEAKKAGCDAVKFQTFKANALVLASAPKAEYQRRQTGDGGQLKMLSELELTFDEFAALKRHCDEIDMDFITTAFDGEALDFVISLQPPCLKWPSGEITNLAMLRQASRSGLPILVSTGMATLGEIDRALSIIRPSCDHVVMQCVSNYPAAIEEQNLRVLPAFASAFGCPVGFSDHTNGSVAAIAARALGMSVLEKHFTLDCKMDGPDHAASMEPDEFSELVGLLRSVEAGLGDGVKRQMESESDTKAVARKSLVYARALPKGHRLSSSDLTAKRPANGIGAEHLDLVLGHKLTRDVFTDHQVALDDLTSR